MNLIPKNFFLDDVFDDFLPSKETNLKCDIYEKDNKYYIEMDAFGFDKNDVKIDYDKGYLNISVSKNEEKNEESKNYIRRERYLKEFKRAFYIGDIDSNNIKANFEKGTLKIEFPKEEEKQNKKIIDIE